ncbi:MAG: molybdopterin-dependent oxidoreductase [Solirubrobacteraceae bacterium]
MSAPASPRDRLRKRLQEPPPGPFRPTFWRSPLRGPWLTSLLGSLLAPAIVIMALTGLISHDNYHPNLRGNAIVDPAHDIGVLLSLPTSGPSWLYALTQGIHVTLGLVTIPLLLAKLWSVIPKLFQWPAVRSVANAIERLSLLLLVGGALFEFATGVLNIQNYYPWHFNFVVAHYWGAWVFFAAFLLHVAIKMPTVVRSFRARGVLGPLRDDLLHTRPESALPVAGGAGPARSGQGAAGAEADGLIPVAPAAPTLSRRGLLALVGGASLTILVVNVGESIGGPFRRLALLAPRGRVFGTGPNDFQVNRTTVSAGIAPELIGPDWRLSLRSGATTLELTREHLMAMPQHDYDLTIACVEGWSTTQRWTGVRLSDLAARAGAPPRASVIVQSVQPSGSFRGATLSSDQVSDEHSLLALCVNGVDLSPDHGFPARIIAPGLPGVHCTKWVGSMSFEAA